MKTRPHPPARPHGQLSEVFPGYYFVTGTAAVPGPIPVRFSQGMTVVRRGGDLVLVNAFRLSEAGLAELEKLGRVTDVIRLAGNHGAGDPFYKERYGAKVWALAGAPYMPGFDPKEEPYFEPDVRFDSRTELPLAGARIHIFHSTPPEALLVMPDHGGIAIAGDSLQNWSNADEYFNWVGRLMMRMMGFLVPYNVGPGWLKQCKPPASDLHAVLELPRFEHLLPAHGVPVQGAAQEHFRPAIERAARSVS